MSIWDQSVELQLKVEVTQSADSSQELVASAQHFVDALDGVSDYLTGVATFNSRLSITGEPPIDPKAASSAVRAFRAGLTQHKLKAVQQQPAAKLVEVAKEQRLRSARWVGERWREVFDDYQAQLEEAGSGRLLGNSVYRITAEGRAAKMSMLRRQDPVADAPAITAALCAGDANLSWPAQVKVLGDELTRALQALKDEHAALTPAVQQALEAASSVDGLSLADVTPELLAGLRTARVDDDLVVRRR